MFLNAFDAFDAANVWNQIFLKAKKQIENLDGDRIYTLFSDLYP